MNIFRKIRKRLDKIPQSKDGYTHAGNWRLLYSSGQYTVWVTYDVALNFQRIFGGTIQHKSDVKEK